MKQPWMSAALPMKPNLPTSSCRLSATPSSSVSSSRQIVRRAGHVQRAAIPGRALRKRHLVGKHRAAVEAPVAVGVFQHADHVGQLLEQLFGRQVQARVVGDEQPAAIVEPGHHRMFDQRRGCHPLDRESVGHANRIQRLSSAAITTSAGTMPPAQTTASSARIRTRHLPDQSLRVFGVRRGSSGGFASLAAFFLGLGVGQRLGRQILAGQQRLQILGQRRLQIGRNADLHDLHRAVLAHDHGLRNGFGQIGRGRLALAVERDVDLQLGLCSRNFSISSGFS